MARIAMFIVLVVGLAALIGWLATSPITKDSGTESTNLSRLNPPDTDEERQQAVNQFKRRLFEEGVSITGNVEMVIPDFGFTLRGNGEDIIFVHQPITTVTSGEAVTVEGVVKQTDEEAIRDLQERPGFTSEIGTIIQDAEFYVEAKEVSRR